MHDQPRQEYWLIQPLQGAGVAGGEKFIVGHLYGGDDEKATKMDGQE